MGYCPTCGANLSEDSNFCVTCGNQVVKAMAATSGGRTIEVAASTAPTWWITYATGQTGGPYTEDDIRGMIARQQIKITDSVAANGSSLWVPITQSPFARFIVSQASIDRLAASTCPRCGGAMIVILRRSGTSKAFLITGILTIWMFGFGFIFLIIGYITGRNPSPRYECPRCKYKAR
jgi:hypothetical protein